MSTKARVELVYEPGCPHVGEARASIRAALAAEGLALEWTERDASDPELPAHLTGYGSPSVLVDGRDVEAELARARCCRVYRAADGRRSGAPSVERIAAALRAGDR